MWETANLVVNRIHVFQPDLIVVVLTSGAMVWRAAERLWKATEGDPPPRVLAMHIHTLPELDVSESFYEMLHRTGLGEEVLYGQVVHWAQQQSHLIARFRATVRDYLGGATPQRILFINDVVAAGETFALGLGLAHAAFPQAAVEWLAGFDFYWRQILVNAWLEEQNAARNPVTSLHAALPYDTQIWRCTNAYAAGATGSAGLEPLDTWACVKKHGDLLTVAAVEQIRIYILEQVDEVIDANLSARNGRRSAEECALENPTYRLTEDVRLWQALDACNGLTFIDVLVLTGWDVAETARYLEQCIWNDFLVRDGDLYVISHYFRIL